MMFRGGRETGPLRFSGDATRRAASSSRASRFSASSGRRASRSSARSAFATSSAAGSAGDPPNSPSCAAGRPGGVRRARARRGRPRRPPSTRGSAGSPARARAPSGGQPGELRDLDAVAPRRAALHELAQEDDLLADLPHRDGEVLHRRALAREVLQLVVVRREQRAAADRVVEVLRHRPRDRDAVEGGGAAANLVEDDERSAGRVVEDGARLGHLDHEGRAARARGRRTRPPA